MFFRCLAACLCASTLLASCSQEPTSGRPIGADSQVSEQLEDTTGDSALDQLDAAGTSESSDIEDEPDAADSMARLDGDATPGEDADRARDAAQGDSNSVLDAEREHPDVIEDTDVGYESDLSVNRDGREDSESADEDAMLEDEVLDLATDQRAYSTDLDVHAHDQVSDPDRTEGADQINDYFADEGNDGSVDQIDHSGGVCALAIPPDQSLTLDVDRIFYTNVPRIFAAGGELFVTGPFSEDWSTWYHWTGEEWKEESIPWPDRIDTAEIVRTVPLPDGAVAFEIAATDEAYLARFDGRTMTDVLLIPEDWTNYLGQVDDIRRFTFVDGAYYTLNKYEWNGAWEMHRGSLDEGWTSLGEAPVPAAVTFFDNAVLAASDAPRLVVAYIQNNGVWVRSQTPGGTWSEPALLNDGWAVTAKSPVAMSAADGGVLIAVNGQSTSYTLTEIW
ncbi:MAG: hypothetical protein KC561_15930, partial [Myxococcales bacterium]|nr:hypothetical protein [Myxococcales bacterium]